MIKIHSEEGWIKTHLEGSTIDIMSELEHISIRIIRLISEEEQVDSVELADEFVASLKKHILNNNDSSIMS